MSVTVARPAAPPRQVWTHEAVEALLALPFPDLMFQAQSVHRAHFDPNAVQVSSLLSIKTGGCPEDCAYCPQSARHDTSVDASKLMPIEAVLDAARAALAQGASRFCMGAAWRSPKDHDLDAVCQMVEAVRGLGLETCVTLGMLTAPQAQRLQAAGLATTTTTWIPRRSTTVRSSPHGSIRTGSIRLRTCVMPASMSVAAGS